MQGVTHHTISTNGISMHFVEMGSGPVVLFLHGFPEGCYGWRKQIAAFAEAGYRAVAPDLRGYGKTSAPEGVGQYTYLHIVGDLIGLLDALQVEKTFLVTHDWGAIIGWQLALFRPDRVIALASLSIYFTPRSPAGSVMELLRRAHGDDFYMWKFQAPGEAEALFASLSSQVFLTLCYAGKFQHRLEALNDEKGNVSLPEWMTEQELAYCVAEIDHNHGFTPALNYYRAMDLSWQLTAPWTGSKVMVPTIFIIGDKDIVYNFHGAKEYIHNQMALDVPFLKEIIVLEGAHHFVQLEKPDVVNHHILKFFKNF